MIYRVIRQSSSLLTNGNSSAICRSVSHFSPNHQPILAAIAQNRHNPTCMQITNARFLQGYVPDPAMGYKKNLEKVTTKQHIVDGLKQLKKEVVLWKEEWKEKLKNDPIVVYRPGTYKLSVIFFLIFEFQILSNFAQVRSTWCGRSVTMMRT